MASIATASQILSDESKWTKESYCLLSNGKQDVCGNSANACAWCLVGALEKKHLPTLYSKEHDEMPLDEFNALLFEIEEDKEALSRSIQSLYPDFPNTPVTFNDHPDVTFSMVRKVLEDAGV